MPTQRAVTRKPAPAAAHKVSSHDALHTLAKAVVAKLAAEGRTVATAESCTGGLLAGALTDVPGVSKVFPGGLVAYSDEAKEALLEIPGCLLAQHGAVSAEVAAAMACAVAEKFGADYGIATTGFAGPEGGTASDPVGTVYFGFSSPTGLWACRMVFEGDRALVREHAVEHALDWLRRKLKKYRVADRDMSELRAE